MKNVFRSLLLVLTIVLTSCQSRVVSPTKPLRDNKIELYQSYNIQTNDSRRMKVQVLRLDQDNIYGKNSKGEDVVIAKNEVREMRKFDFLASVGVIAAAIAALLLIPV